MIMKNIIYMNPNIWERLETAGGYQNNISDADIKMHKQ